MRGGRGFLIAAALIVIAAGLKAAEDLAVPFLLAAFIAVIAATPMAWLERRGLPGWLAISLVMVGVLGAIFGVGALVVQAANDFSGNLPGYQARLNALFGATLGWLESLGVPLSRNLLLDTFNPATAFTLAGNALAGFGNVLSNSFLILLTVIFILAEATSFPRKLRAILADPENAMPHFTRFADTMNRYIAIKTSISIGTGLLVTCLLLLLGVDYPILWGLLAFLLNFVPAIGSLIAAIPAVLLGLVESGPMTALLVAVGYLAINLILGNIVEPRFMGGRLGLSTLVVFLSLVLWGWLFGPVGMLLSVPLTMTVKIALEANPDTRWLALLLGPARDIEPPEPIAPAIADNPG